MAAKVMRLFEKRSPFPNKILDSIYMYFTKT